MSKKLTISKFNELSPNFPAKHNPEEPRYFGKHFKTLDGYASGGAGYVISREALRRLEDVFAKEKQPERCRFMDKIGAEDANLGKYNQSYFINYG